MLKTGDILHCSGKRLVPRLIKAFTRSPFSHSALFIEIWGQPYIIDAQKDGVNVRPFKEWKAKYNYDYIIHRNISDYDQKELAKKALSKVGLTAYDFESLIFRQPFELMTGKWNVRKDEQTKMYCSEFVAWVWGADASYRMSPKDLYEWCLVNNFVEKKETEI